MPLPPAVLNPSSLTAGEREVLESVHAVTVSAEHPVNRSLAEALATSACSDQPAGAGHVHLRPSAAMLNRAGRVLGGVLFAAEAAKRAAADAFMKIASGHMQFITAADADEVIDVTPLVLWSGRQFLFARTDLRQGSRLVATGSFRLQRDT